MLKLADPGGREPPDFTEEVVGQFLLRCPGCLQVKHSPAANISERSLSDSRGVLRDSEGRCLGVFNFPGYPGRPLDEDEFSRGYEDLSCCSAVLLGVLARNRFSEHGRFLLRVSKETDLTAPSGFRFLDLDSPRALDDDI